MNIVRVDCSRVIRFQFASHVYLNSLVASRSDHCYVLIRTKRLEVPFPNWLIGMCLLRKDGCICFPRVLTVMKSKQLLYLHHLPNFRTQTMHWSRGKELEYVKDDLSDPKIPPFNELLWMWRWTCPQRVLTALGQTNCTAFQKVPLLFSQPPPGSKEAVSLVCSRFVQHCSS